MRIDFALRLRIESLNRGQRLGLKTLRAARAQRFAQRGKVKHHRSVAHMTMLANLKPGHRRALVSADRIVLTLTRIGPGTLDDDNLAAAFKPTRDGLAAALGMPDNHPALRFLYEQRSGGRAVYSATVTLETMTRTELGARLAERETSAP